MGKGTVDSDRNVKSKSMATLDYVTVQGGGKDVDAFGDMEKKVKGGNLDVKGGNAQNAKDLTKVDAMGSDYPKKGKGKEGPDQFKVSTEVDPSGTDCGKGNYRNNVG